MKAPRAPSRLVVWLVALACAATARPAEASKSRRRASAPPRWSGSLGMTAASSEQGGVGVTGDLGLAYALSRGLALELAAAYAEGGHAYDPTAGVSATTAVDRGLFLRASLMLAFPATSEDRDRTQPNAATLATALDAVAGRFTWSLQVQNSQGVASSQFGLGAFVSYAATRHLTFRTGSFVTRVRQDPGIGLWATDATLIEGSVSGESLAASLALAATGLGPVVVPPDAVSVRFGVRLALRGSGR